MKQITNEQCGQIINAFFEKNAPVKLYGAIKEMLDKLPEIKTLEGKEKVKKI